MDIIAKATGPVEVIHRPDAPYDLTDEETEEWRSVVARMPPTWFERETHALLSAYCRHVISARRISQLIEQLLRPAPVAEGEREGDDDTFDVEAYDRLLKMRERESRAISSLATRMRISQQASYDKSKKRPPSGRKPWEARKG